MADAFEQPFEDASKRRSRIGSVGALPLLLGIDVRAGFGLDLIRFPPSFPLSPLFAFGLELACTVLILPKLS